jgi:TetR/AcrR family transcriptional regulator
VVEPRHLIMMIWAVTQHYADFDAQVQAVLGADAAPARRFADAEATLMTTLLEGLRPRWRTDHAPFSGSCPG